MFAQEFHWSQSCFPDYFRARLKPLCIYSIHASFVHQTNASSYKLCLCRLVMKACADTVCCHGRNTWFWNIYKLDRCKWGPQVFRDNPIWSLVINFSSFLPSCPGCLRFCGRTLGLSSDLLFNFLSNLSFTCLPPPPPSSPSLPLASSCPPLATL